MKNTTRHIQHDGKTYSVANDFTDDETGAREWNIYAVIAGVEVGDALNDAGTDSYPSRAAAVRDIKKGHWSELREEVVKNLLGVDSPHRQFNKRSN